MRRQRRFEQIADLIMAAILVAVAAGTFGMMLFDAVDSLLCKPRDGAMIVLPNTDTAKKLLCPTNDADN